MNEVVTDTSVLIAVITRGTERQALLDLTSGTELVAPSSVHWEIGNAFSTMIRRKRITLGQARRALIAYRQIPIRFVDVELDPSIEIAGSLMIYAYDAYLLGCARRINAPLITLDRGLARAAKEIGIDVLEVV
jgi:predicted nucleic acid-binding protein